MWGFAIFVSIALPALSNAFFGLSDGLHAVFHASAETKKLGEECTTTVDCIRGAFCDDGTCRCLSTHLEIEDSCWRKLNPGETGCAYDEQCDAVWPTTRCRQGICRCALNEKLSETREGNVCHLPGQCPTNGAYGALYERNSHDRATCVFLDPQKKSGAFMGCDEFPELHDCIDGTCCPTREQCKHVQAGSTRSSGLACAQPNDEGDAVRDDAVAQQRWYHNAAARRCQPFNYSGSGGNANNFLSKQHCESYCLARCERGDPPLSFDSQDSCSNSPISCGDNFGCLQVTTDRFSCCPTPAFVCSSHGGVVVQRTNESEFSVGSNRLGKESALRWFWDSPTLLCKKFKFHGQGGNFNNFQSKNHCVEYCSKGLCPWGRALRDPADDVQRCSTAQRCPLTHECHRTVCCPKPGQFCLLHVEKGEDCGVDPTTRWAFDAPSASCRSFLFSGCGGNDNNFPSLQLCQQLCAQVEVEPVCPYGRPFRSTNSLFAPKCSKDSNACPPNYECTFDNNIYACCPTKPFVCSQSVEKGSLCGSSELIRWFFDVNRNECVAFEYLGCDGNDNNFQTRLHCSEACSVNDCPDGGDPLVDESSGTKISCSTHDECPSTHRCSQLIYSRKSACCPSREFTCSQPMNDGQACGTTSKRFHFDSQTQTCRTFDFKGCGGNSNNFGSRVACYNFCLSSACASSEIVYLTSTSDLPFDCTLQSCPRGYTCVRDIWKKEKAVCCGALNQESCPQGGRVSTWTATAKPRGCVQDAQCPTQTTCYSPLPYSIGLCCSSTDEVCPPTFSYEKEQSEKKECSPLERSSCSVNRQSVCLFSELRQRFVCCRREARLINAIARCPVGSLLESQRITCDPETPCPSTHFCVKRAADRNGICCRHPKVERLKGSTHRLRTTLPPPSYKVACPMGQFVLRNASDVRTCDFYNLCPPNYVCTNQVGMPSVCCGKHDRDLCGNRVWPLEDFEECNEGRKCPDGYDCEDGVCCAADENACSHPFSSGRICDGEFPSTRFFFDATSTVCRPFIFSGCSGSGNNFFTRQACISACGNHVSAIAMAELEKVQCPKPFANPGDHPQVCVVERTSCAVDERCVQSQNGLMVCCKRPPALRIYMRNVCGASFIPKFNEKGDVTRCETHSDCAKSYVCKKSDVLLHTICCRRDQRENISMSLYSDGEKKCSTNSTKCYRLLYAGEAGCTTNEHCQMPAECVDSMCQCRKGTVQFHRICTSFCPPYYKNISGVCV